MYLLIKDDISTVAYIRFLGVAQGDASQHGH